MGGSQAYIDQETPIFSGIKIDIPFAQQLVSSDVEKQEINWDASKYSLQKAIISIDATQTYDSGADLTLLVNNTVLASVTSQIHWNAFETQRKTIDIDITSDLLDGLNVFQMQYHTADGVITAQECVANATLKLTFLGPATTGQPASYSNPGGPSAWQQFLKDGKTYLIIGGVIMLVGAGIALVIKFSGFAWIKSLFNRISR